jgi:hypothetical protein
VHDIDGRVQRVAQLLAGRGYVVEVAQEQRFQACNLHMVYARRP